MGPHKSMCKLFPTNNCLVNLIEIPFTVVTLDEIEVVNLERAALHLKNFDMSIVNKDFSSEVLRIELISSNNLELVKTWLDSISLNYYVSKANLNWKHIMKTITDEPSQFYHNGGWNFLNLELTDSDEVI